MDEVNDSDDETVGADFNGGVFGALQSHRSFGDTRRPHLFGREGGKTLGFEFVFTVWEGGRRGDHRFTERFVDQMNDEFPGGADVEGCIFGSLAVLVAGGEGD